MRRRVFLLVLALAIAAYAGRTAILRQLGSFLVDEEPPVRADAIVVLAGTSEPDRVLEAAALYRDGFAPRIVLSREPESPAYRQLPALGVRVPSVHDRHRSVLEQLGIPPAAIVEVGGAPGSTVSEAADVLEYLRAHQIGSILLATSRLHSRRAAMVYRRLGGGSLRVTSRPSRYDDFDAGDWWRHRTSTRRVLIECQKLLVYLLVDQWRLAAGVSPARGFAGNASASPRRNPPEGGSPRWRGWTGASRGCPGPRPGSRG